MEEALFVVEKGQALMLLLGVLIGAVLIGVFKVSFDVFKPYMPYGKKKAIAWAIAGFYFVEISVIMLLVWAFFG